MTYEQLAIKYMKEHGSVTATEFAIAHDTTKLTTIISAMRAKGIKVNDVDVKVKDERGKVVRTYKRYSLPEE